MKSHLNSKLFFIQKHLLILILGGITVLWAGCEKDYHYVEPAAVVPPIDTTLPPISFSASIQPVFTAECATSGCHDGSEDLDLRTGHSYTSLFAQNDIDTINPPNSKLYKRIILPSSSGQFMPTGGSPLPAADINNIIVWIQQGAPNN